MNIDNAQKTCIAMSTADIQYEIIKVKRGYMLRSKDAQGRSTTVIRFIKCRTRFLAEFWDYCAKRGVGIE